MQLNTLTGLSGDIRSRRILWRHPRHYLDGVQASGPNILQRLAYWYTENEIRDAIDSGNGPDYFANLLPDDMDPIAAAKSWSQNTAAATPPGAMVSARNAWQRMLDGAERFNKPGEFTF